MHTCIDFIKQPLNKIWQFLSFGRLLSFLLPIQNSDIVKRSIHRNDLKYKTYAFRLKITLTAALLKLSLVTIGYLLSSYLTLATAEIEVTDTNLNNHEDALVIAFSSAPSTVDPHHLNIASETALNRHLYDSLFNYGNNGELKPHLAINYEILDDHTWLITLRPDVVFHDGSRLTTRDVVYSFDRILKFNGFVSSYRFYLNKITSYKAINTLQLEIKTASPAPDLLNNLAEIYIIKATDNGRMLTAQEYNAQEQIIGTGAFIFKGRSKERREFYFRRNEEYFLKLADWRNLVIKHYDDREKALEDFIAGKVHAVEKVTNTDVRLLQDLDDFQFFKVDSNRIMHLTLDSVHDKTPSVRVVGRDELLNPLKNRAVRAAISQAIDRNYLVDKIIGGGGVPTFQYTTSNQYGYNPYYNETGYNPEVAKKLLAQAGYPNGFELTLYTTKDHYLKDASVIKAVATMLREIGINATAVALPKNQFFAEVSQYKYSMSLVGWVTDSGRLIDFIAPTLRTRDSERSLGLYNVGPYSNPLVDEYIDKALISLNKANEIRYTRYATDLLLKDYAVIPLYFESSVWALTRAIEFVPSSDSGSIAYQFQRAD